MRITGAFLSWIMRTLTTERLVKGTKRQKNSAALGSSVSPPTGLKRIQKLWKTRVCMAAGEGGLQMCSNTWADYTKQEVPICHFLVNSCIPLLFKAFQHTSFARFQASFSKSFLLLCKEILTCGKQTVQSVKLDHTEPHLGQHLCVFKQRNPPIKAKLSNFGHCLERCLSV